MTSSAPPPTARASRSPGSTKRLRPHARRRRRLPHRRPRRDRAARPERRRQDDAAADGRDRARSGLRRRCGLLGLDPPGRASGSRSGAGSATCRSRRGCTRGSRRSTSSTTSPCSRSTPTAPGGSGRDPTGARVGRPAGRDAQEDPRAVRRHAAAGRARRGDGRQPRPAGARRAGERARPRPAAAAALAAVAVADGADVDAQHLRGRRPVPPGVRDVLRPGPVRRARRPTWPRSPPAASGRTTGRTRRPSAAG